MSRPPCGKDSDIWLLSRQYEFDGAVLARAIQKTFANRKTPIPAGPPALTREFADDRLKQTQWSGFLRKTQLDGVPSDLHVIVDAIRVFLEPAAAAARENEGFDRVWKAQGPWMTSSA